VLVAGEGVVLARFGIHRLGSGDKPRPPLLNVREPNELVASYHDRMPLALADEKIEPWLDLSNEPPLDDNLQLALDEFTVRQDGFSLFVTMTTSTASLGSRASCRSAGLDLSLRPLAGLAQDEEPGVRGGTGSKVPRRRRRPESQWRP
jgi:hypothetical protein